MKKRKLKYKLMSVPMAILRHDYTFRCYLTNETWKRFLITLRGKQYKIYWWLNFINRCRTVAHSRSSLLAVFWQRLPTADVRLPLGSRTLPCFSYGNSRLINSTPLKISTHTHTHTHSLSLSLYWLCPLARLAFNISARTAEKTPLPIILSLLHKYVA
jgi:hypothetical protein